MNNEKSYINKNLYPLIQADKRNYDLKSYTKRDSNMKRFCKEYLSSSTILEMSKNYQYMVGDDFREHSKSINLNEMNDGLDFDLNTPTRVQYSGQNQKTSYQQTYREPTGIYGDINMIGSRHPLKTSSYSERGTLINYYFSYYKI